MLLRIIFRIPVPDAMLLVAISLHKTNNHTISVAIHSSDQPTFLRLAGQVVRGLREANQSGYIVVRKRAFAHQHFRQKLNAIDMAAAERGGPAAQAPFQCGTVISPCYFLKHQSDLISIITVSAIAVANDDCFGFGASHEGYDATAQDGAFITKASLQSPFRPDLPLGEVCPIPTARRRAAASTA
jgi:hypothetical protein